MKKILFITRPIAPPWDEASKNFAYNLAKSLSLENSSSLEIHLLTKDNLLDLSSNIIQHTIYTSSKKDFKLSQKLRLFIFLIFNARKFDVIHLFFTPTKLNGWILKRVLKSPLIPLLQRGKLGGEY